MKSGRTTRTHGTGAPGRGNGFSLVESLIALAILAMVFTAIATAIGAGTASADETRARVTATLAAEELLAEVLTEDWSGLPDWHGFEEVVGSVSAPDGRQEDSRGRFSRSALVVDEVMLLEPSGIEVAGRSIIVQVHDRDGRRLIRLQRFVAATGENET